MIPSRFLGLCLALLSLLSSGRALAAADSGYEEKVPLVGERSNWRTLAQRIPSVTRRTVTKAGRIELAPSLNLSLTDTFYQLVGGSVALQYHFFEFLSAGITGAYYGGLDRIIVVAGPDARRPPAYNRATYTGRADVNFSPLYGKISWLAEAVAHFDTYLSVGAGLMGLQTGGSSLTGGVALGQHYFINPEVAIKLELRHDWYKMNRVPASATKANVQGLLSASVGVSFYLPKQAALKE